MQTLASRKDAWHAFTKWKYHTARVRHLSKLADYYDKNALHTFSLHTYQEWVIHNKINGQ